jgi:hypothetical protein
MYASQQIANPQIFIINPQITNPHNLYKKPPQLCLKKVLKVELSFYSFFHGQILIRAL